MSMTEKQRKLLAYAGNLSQLAGIRNSVITGGRGGGMRIAEVWNAAGLRFTVLPDRCCDIYGLSYRGINLSYISKNGLTSDKAVSATRGEFSWQWQGGALVTCGLDNAGGHSGNCPLTEESAGFPRIISGQIVFSTERTIFFVSPEKCARHGCTVIS